MSAVYWRSVTQPGEKAVLAELKKLKKSDLNIFVNLGLEAEGGQREALNYRTDLEVCEFIQMIMLFTGWILMAGNQGLILRLCKWPYVFLH